MKVVTQEELKQLTELRESILSIVTSLGELHLNKLELRDELDRTEARVRIEEESYRQFREKERVLFEQFKAKYGTGNIDLVTGEITD